MIYIDFPRGESATIPQIALQGEYGAHAVRWDLTQEAFYTQWPSGHGTIWFAKADSSPWPLDAVQTGDMIEAELGSTETAETGMVKVCLVWAKGDTVLAKTRWYWLEIGESAYGGSEPGEPASDWLAAIASIQEAAETAAEAAAASESNAAGSEEEADAAALDAEAWAVGTRDGAAVDENDPAYHNNAKWYAEQIARMLGIALNA